MKKTLMLVVAGAFVGTVYAAESDNNKPYVEIGYTNLTYIEDPYTLSPSNLRFVIGKNEGAFGYEGLLATSLSQGTVTISGTAVNYKVNNILGIYGKARTNPSENLEVFGRLGYAKMDGTASAGSLSANNSGGGLSYGAGAKYTIAKGMNVNLDYMVYYPKTSGVSLTGFTIGLGIDF